MRSQGMKNRLENRREQKERSREQVPSPATLEHSVASYDAQGLYSEPILFTSPPPHPIGEISISGNVEQIWEQVKQAMVDSARVVCGSVRVGERTHRMYGGMKW